jgi:hypothetical protein
MIVKCVVAGYTLGGEPDFYFCNVECTKEEFDSRDHCDTAEAEAAALNSLVVDNMVVFDEFDGPDWLFKYFAWHTATTVRADGDDD